MGKIGLLGGTFDPIHNAHLFMGKAAIEALSLDKLIYIPAGITPHKQAYTTDAHLRYEMVKLAVADMQNTEVSDYETNKTTPSYSVETVAHFRSVYPDDELVFIVGEDSLGYIDKWYDASRLLAMCSFAVLGRGGYDSDINEKIAGLEKDFGAKIYYIKTEELEIASRDIRTMIAAGENVGEFVPERVLGFINEHGMYK